MNIIDPNEEFNFADIQLTHPVGIQGGAYFTKIEFNKKPLYIQTTKCLTRQGIVKSGKKFYSDLMFDKNSETIIHWFENLEEKCKKLIYEKKEAWFQDNLEESDIENAFNPLIRIYKSGKYYLLRTNIKTTKDELPALKIYDENERIVPYTDINSETEIVSILDIQGIKFSTRNFQIEIELKQIMVIDNQPIFESCLIKSSKNKSSEITSSTTTPSITPDTPSTVVPSTVVPSTVVPSTITESPIDVPLESIDFPELELESMIEYTKQEESINESNMSPLDDIVDDNACDNESINIEFEELNADIPNDLDELKEISDLDNLDKTVDCMTLKKPNQVYFDLYKEARNKAKIAKKNAILAYLEAKNIKKTYMIENIDDSDNEFDAEIDDVSESELDGL
jgi:hypothetical protein